METRDLSLRSRFLQNNNGVTHQIGNLFWHLGNIWRGRRERERERERERVRDRCVRAEENDSGGADVLFLKHVSSILRVIQPCMWFIEVPSQFSMVQTTQRLSCSIMAKIHSWLDDCLRMLQACFRKKTCTKEEENLFGLEFQRRNRGTRARLSSAQTATKIWWKIPNGRETQPVFSCVNVARHLI